MLKIREFYGGTTNARKTMSQTKTGIAVLGTGRWGSHLVRNFLEHPDAHLVAIADSNPEHLAELRQRLPIPDTTVLSVNWREAIATAGVEAVAIATPASTHTPLIRESLHLGLHVLVEKPMTLDVEEAIDLCQLADREQRRLIVDHTYLFHPVVAVGEALMQQGGVGTPRYGYATRTHLGPVRPDVDALWDLAIHDIAILNQWLGDRPCQAEARGSIWLQPDTTHPTLFRAGLSDTVWATLTYPSGFQATLHLCWLNPDKQRRLCVVGTEGTLVFDEMQTEAPLQLLQGHLRQDGAYFWPAGQANQVIPTPKAEPLKQVCTHFLQQIHQPNEPCISDGWTGLDLIRILVALSESLNQDGRAIKIRYR